MLPSKEYLSKLAAKYQEKADRAFMNYQETGIQRYDRERRNNEDMADSLRAAANAVEDRGMLGSLKAEFVWLSGQADKAIAENAPRERLVDILKGLISFASVTCGYSRLERPEGTRDEN